jgi:hypothetical protein
LQSWSKDHLGSERFDPTLWCVVRAGDEIAAGTICTGDTYGRGFVQALFTRRPWRKQGVGAALLGDSFGRFWERGEHSIGLGVDAASDTGAFQFYERAGMTPVLGWVVYEKELAMPRELRAEDGSCRLVAPPHRDAALASKAAARTRVLVLITADRRYGKVLDVVRKLDAHTVCGGMPHLDYRFADGVDRHAGEAVRPQPNRLHPPRADPRERRSSRRPVLSATSGTARVTTRPAGAPPPPRCLARGLIGSDGAFRFAVVRIHFAVADRSMSVTSHGQREGGAEHRQGDGQQPSRAAVADAPLVRTDSPEATNTKADHQRRLRALRRCRRPQTTTPARRRTGHIRSPRRQAIRSSATRRHVVA